MGQSMTSVHLYQAEKKDIDLADLNFPDVDKPKLTKFINTILQKGKIILAKDLDKNELVGCCIFHKSEFWFSKGQIFNIDVIYIKKNFRNYKLLKTMIDSVKKIANKLPIVLGVTTGLKIDPVFKRLGFENLGSNWRLM